MFLPDGTFLPLPKLATEPFLKLWEEEVFALLLAEGKITEDVVANIRSWKHSGFSVDQSVRLEAGDQEGVQRLIQYFLRCPFSQARMIQVTEAGKVIYNPRATGPTATRGGGRNGDSRPLPLGARGSQRVGGAPQTGLRRKSALLSSMRGRAQNHRLHRAAPDRRDREDSPSLRAVGRALSSCPAFGGDLGYGLRLKAKESWGAVPPRLRRGGLHGPDPAGGRDREVRSERGGDGGPKWRGPQAVRPPTPGRTACPTGPRGFGATSLASLGSGVVARNT